MAGRFSFSLPENHSSRPWFRLGQLDVTTTVLVTLMCVAAMFVWAIDRSVLAWLALIPSRVLQGEIWRLVTWPIPTEPTLWTIITLAIFWYFGREIEGLLGRNRFAWFLLTLTLVPAVVATILNLPQAGIRPLQFAVFLVFIAQYPFARFFFGIPAWALGAVFVGLEVLQLVGMRNERGIVFLFVTIATAAITARSYGLATSLHWVPVLALPGSGTERAKPAKNPRRSGRSPRGTVVDGPWPAPAPSFPTPDSVAAQAELDMLLDKISASGLESLTGDEKRRLNELSKRLR
jgi:membrane associated rhomboid family serine protease